MTIGGFKKNTISFLSLKKTAEPNNETLISILRYKIFIKQIHQNYIFRTTN